MSLTINDQPDANVMHPGYNLLQYLVDSTNTTQDNYKLIATIFTDLDSGGRQIAPPLKYDKRPDSTKSLVAVQRIIQSELSEPTTNIQAETSDLFQHQNFKAFQVQFMEFYGSIPIAVTGSSVSGNTVYCNNAAYRYHGWAKTQAATELNWYYLFGNGGSELNYNNWLTSINNNASSVSGTTVTLKSNDPFYPIQATQITPLMFRHESTQATVMLQSFDSSLVLNETATIDLTGLTATPKSIGMIINDTAINGSTFATGSMTLTSSDKYLAVMYLDHSGNRNSVVKIYQLDWSPCTKYDLFEIHWLNHSGGWDSYTFTMRSEQTRNVIRNEYQRLTTTVSGNNIVNNLNAQKTGRYYTELKDRYVLNSDNTPEWLKEGLVDLYTSPLIYWNGPDGFVQIKNVTEEEYRFEKTTDMIFNVRFVFEIDNNDITQRS